MSGFPVPAKAGALAIERLYDAQDGEADTDEMARVCLEAALPVLAADPDLIERLAESLWGAFPFHPKPDEYRRERAARALAALFGVASPSTKETETDER